MSKFYYKKITENGLKGEFSDKLKEIQTNVDQKISEQEEKQKKLEADRAAERASKLYIGDPEVKIRDIYGEPDRVHRTVTAGHEFVQYVYGDFYVYTEDGVVTSFQN